MTTKVKYGKKLISYRSLLNAMSEPAFCTDTSFIIQSWNEASEKIFGLTEDQVMDHYLFSLIDFAIVGGALAQVLESIHVTGHWVGITVVVYPNGKELSIQVSIDPIYDVNGHLIGYVSVSKDITETVEAKGSLTALQKMFTAFMDHSPTLTWIIDDEGYCHFFNDLYLKTFHLDHSVIGKHASQLFPKEIVDPYLENNAIVFQTDQPLEFIETAVGPDGKKIILKVLKFPLDLPGMKKYLGGVAINITKEVEKQEQLSLINERFRLVNKATSDHIWDWDIVADRIVTDGFEEAENERKNWHSLEESLGEVNVKDRERIKESLHKAIADKGRQYWEEEYSALDGKGSYKTVIDKGYIIRNASGKAMRMIGAQHDITELKVLQHRLLEQEKNRQREIVKAVIDAQEKERHEIAHELHDNVNQLLTTCKLQLEAAEHYANDETYLSRISSYVQSIINEIRSISHQLNPANIGTIGLIPTIDDIVSKINAAGKLAIAFDYKKIKANERFDKDIELIIFRIIQEQIQNIIKHAAAKQASIALEKNQSKLYLSIEDDGKGFDLSVTKKGLGLTNIINRAEYFGGEVEINTSLGKGCKVLVTLPL
ncbi:PAS domain S-box protein [Flavisolibacter tropicus]|uniref:histidine kinase n=1 Tax=Flavisolibacter tropicus TaxID=1492898 RepID=A0A172TQI1_9BACT|nr:PAS domain S-box protein [Flavisolibacter tropicus]ANE49236.1 hypothetical protein SY85_00670 [Flavisolibacter tropicus]